MNSNFEIILLEKLLTNSFICFIDFIFKLMKEMCKLFVKL